MKLHKSLLLFGASALLLTACGDDGGSTEISDPAEEIDAEEVAQDVEASEAEETKASEIGKRSNPVPLGKLATFPVLYSDEEYNEIKGVVTVEISNPIRGQEAYDLLIEHNEFNEEAPDGQEWVVFDVSLTLDEGSEDDPFNTSVMTITPIASDGSEVPQSDYATFENGVDFGWKDLYVGGTDSGKYGLLVPEGDETLIEVTDWNKSVFFSIN